MTRPFCLGILGGMGPLAGILLQRRIVEATPATRDQEHLPVIHLCDPTIPDRTASLRADGGNAVAERLVAHAQTLERAGATAIAMACHTAHAVHPMVAASVRVPVLHLPEATARHLAGRHVPGAAVGILATDGTIAHRIFHRALEAQGLVPLIPPAAIQKRVADLISGIKSAPRTQERHATELIRLTEALKYLGATAVVLGCTELSVHADAVADDPAAVDPLVVLAEDLVRMARKDVLTPQAP